MRTDDPQSIASDAPVDWRIPAVQIVVLLVLFGKLHSVLIDETFKLAWRDPDWGHALLVPLVSAFFVWDRREKLKAVTTRPTWWFLAPLLIGIVIYFASLFVRSLFLMGVATGFTTAAMIMGVGGWPLLRLLAFPVGYLVFAMDLDLFLEPLSRVLQHVAVLGSAELIGVFGSVMDLEAWRTGNVIQLYYQGSPVDPPLNVAEACSGLRMLVSLAAAGVAMAGLLYRPWWFRLLVAAATVPIAIVVNVGRIVVLAMLAPHFPSLSHGELHTHTGGIVMLIPAIILFLGFIRLLDWVVEPIIGETPDETEPPESAESADTVADTVEPQAVVESPASTFQWRRIPTGLYVVLAGIFAVSAFAEIAISRRIEAAFSKNDGAPRQPLTEIPETLGAWELAQKRSFEANIERELGTPYYVDWIYRDTRDSSRGMRLHLAFYAGNGYMLDVWHVPEVCYVGAGSTPMEAGYTDLDVSGELVRMRHFTFSGEDGQRPGTVFYTFLTNGVFVANRHTVKYRALDLRYPAPYVCKVEVLSGSIVVDGAGQTHLIPDRIDEIARDEAAAFLEQALPHIRSCMPEGE